MEKIRVKELIEFRRKSERSKITLVNNLKSNKKLEDDTSPGGDYWVCCLSAIANTFRDNKIELLNEKINLLTEKIKTNGNKKIKDQFQRNIDILHNFRDFDFQDLKPNTELNFLTKPHHKSILNIKGLPIHVKPNHVFAFSKNDRKEVGAIWFIAKIDGFDKGDLGIFVDVLYRYLDQNFSKEFAVNTSYCIAVDVNKAQYVSYNELEEDRIPKLLENTIDEIKIILKK